MTYIPAQWPHWMRHPWAPLALPLLAALVVAAIIIASAFALQPSPSDHAERKLCDRAVDALLHSKDLVEVQRAGIIIRQVNCGIGRRLTDEGM